MKGSSGLHLCPPRDEKFDWRQNPCVKALRSCMYFHVSDREMVGESEVREQQEAEEAD